jgi:hypothetical protein
MQPVSVISATTMQPFSKYFIMVALPSNRRRRFITPAVLAGADLSGEIRRRPRQSGLPIDIGQIFKFRKRQVRDDRSTPRKALHPHPPVPRRAGGGWPSGHHGWARDAIPPLSYSSLARGTRSGKAAGPVSSSAENTKPGN